MQERTGLQLELTVKRNGAGKAISFVRYFVTIQVAFQYWLRHRLVKGKDIEE